MADCDHVGKQLYWWLGPAAGYGNLKERGIECGNCHALIGNPWKLKAEVERLTKSRDYYKDSFETSQNFEKIERDKVIKLRQALKDVHDAASESKSGIVIMHICKMALSLPTVDLSQSEDSSSDSD